MIPNLSAQKDSRCEIVFEAYSTQLTWYNLVWPNQAQSCITPAARDCVMKFSTVLFPSVEPTLYVRIYTDSYPQMFRLWL
jgi:hypothetical protein